MNSFFQIIDNFAKNQEFNPTGLGVFLNDAYLIRKIISSCIKTHAPLLKGKMLDYGCGSRPYEKFFTTSDYVGIDIESSGHPAHNQRADIFFDGINLPFQNDTFDSVLASEVFEHVFQMDICLTELNRVMKKQAKLIITCPFVWPLHEEPYDYARYTPHALRQLLSDHGFSIIKQTQLGTSFDVVSQMIILEIIPRVLHKIFRNSRFCNYAKIPFVGSMNLLSVALSKLFKSQSKLYLTNFVVAEKI